MKKLFAVLSVLALIFTFVGLTKVSASEKFIVDPTIGENDIPVYVMGSIRTTFPRDYDYETEPDNNFQGASRQYPWNETRLQVKQIGDNGEFTGKQYLVYFSGSTSADGDATAMNQLLLTKDGDTVYLSRYDAGVYGSDTMEYKGVTFKYRKNQGPMDGSLSHAAVNVSGETLEFDALQLPQGTGVSSWGQQVYNRAIAFDGQGRAIWGNSTNGSYATADTPNETALPAEYCYINGVATRFDDASKCDKAQVAVLDEDGEPVLDAETGEPTYEEGTEPDYVKSRYVWMWVSNEDWESTYKARTNTVDYLQQGWDPEKWDDEFEKDGGHMLIAFVNAAQSKFAINDAQAAAANANAVGTELEGTYANGTYRKYVALIRVPADGIVYDFGYLDQFSMGSPAEAKFAEMSTQAYLYGRAVDAEGKGMAMMTTYNYSAKPIYETDQVIDGKSYQYLEGTQTIEVLKGAKFNPAKLVTYSGLGRYWGTENLVVSYTNKVDDLRLTLNVNGETKVQYVESYKTFDEMVEAYVADVNAWLESCGKDGFAGVTHVDKPTAADITTTSDWFAIRWGGILAVGSAESKFMKSQWGAKWTWMLDYIEKMSKEVGTSDLKLGSLGEIGWDGGISTFTLLSFLSQSNPVTSGYPRTVVVWDASNSEGWMDKETLSQKFANFAIDTASDNVDKVYNVEYVCENPETGNKSSYAIKFVVVDEYTPIIKLAKAEALKYTPVIADNGSMTFKGVNGTVSAIDPATFATAYNARYNGSSIYGDDISSRMHFTSETLNFNAPTEGAHKVVAKVYNGAKFTEKEFTVIVEDVTAPTAAVVEKVTVQYGSLFNPYDLIQGDPTLRKILASVLCRGLLQLMTS